MPKLTISDKILDTIKKMLGMDPDYTAFDTDVVVNINTALMTLNQLGVGPEDGLTIEDGSETWDDLLDGATMNLQAVKTFVYLSVKLVFDPPSTSFGIESYKNQITELSTRLNMQVETPPNQTGGA